jgi:subtilisin-like proprotein convertase family protein
VGTAFFPATSTPDFTAATRRYSVTLYGLTHSSPGDLDVVLTPPQIPGSIYTAETVLLRNAGDGVSVTNADVTFSGSSHPVPFAGPLGTSTYNPSYYSDTGQLQVGNAFITDLRGPTGTWQLRVGDNYPGDVGAIARGWSLTVNYDVDNRFVIGKLRRNKTKGTGLLAFRVFNPGVIKLRRTKSLRAVTFNAPKAGVYRLRLKARGNAKKRLYASGRAYVAVRASFTPTGGVAETTDNDVLLKKKH